MSNAERGRDPINWTRLVAEGVAIVASILLAFVIDASWDNARDRAVRVESLEAVLGEFEKNVEMLPTYVGRHERAVAALSEIHRRYLATEPGAPFEVADTLLVPAIVGTTFDASQGALAAFLQSGHLAGVRNPKLREALAGWPGNVADATENEFMLNRDYRPPAIDVLASQVEIRQILSVYASDEAMESLRVIVLYASRELSNRLTMVRAYSSSAAREMKELLQEAESIAELLRAELGRP